MDENELVKLMDAYMGQDGYYMKPEAAKEETVYIGDSEVDIETARNAGLESIIVEWGFREREYLKKMGGTCFVRKPSEILRLI